MPFIQNANKPAAKFGVIDTTDTQNADASFISLKNSQPWKQKEISPIWASNNQRNNNNNLSPFVTPPQQRANGMPQKTSPIVQTQRSPPLFMPDADSGRSLKRKGASVESPSVSENYVAPPVAGISEKRSLTVNYSSQPSGDLNQKTTIPYQKRSPALDHKIQSSNFLPSTNQRAISSAGGVIQNRSPIAVDRSQPPILSAGDVTPREAISLVKTPVSKISSLTQNKPKPSRDQTSQLFISALKAGADVNNERDEVAKERRLRRFNDSINQNEKAPHQPEYENLLDKSKDGSRFSIPEKGEAVLHQMVEMDEADGLAEKDWQSAEPVLGVCPDMCAESERHERERKGDLDRLERLDGDRNKTSVDLAVKKYTRTAEKHPSLIRPISVLTMTMDHLLGLLDRGYDDELLGLHNFLWDRMRAVRMDLRMQHIFNLKAVFMHEQMIRFHILAMHELCEYAKGEGFTEGFDAHLNIEQMNKTSVDLFHMYDDLRKSGCSCPNEAELRGYYALLKLDKHPGYVVEPAELSLDLAKMTPEMRNTPEVQFARKVARACRSGNYLAFFKLASDATYLQACLMHAHFSKLRSQAMASLYSGLQKNQGIPLFQVAEWLAMEVEAVEELVEYHGFSLKIYEEPYIVKEGPFLKKDQDFRTRRSRMVEEKRSGKVRDDVLSSRERKSFAQPSFEKISSFGKNSGLQSPSVRRQSEFQSSPLKKQSELNHPALVLVDEEMPDYEEEDLMEEKAKNYQEDSNMHVPYKLSQISSGITTAAIKMHVAAGESLLPNPVPSVLQNDEENEFYPIGKRKKNVSPHRGQGVSLDHKPDENTIYMDKRIRKIEDDISTVLVPKALDVVQSKSPVPVGRRDFHQEENERQVALRAEADRHRTLFVFRKWRAIAARKAEERVWRETKLEEALSTFHLGLPVRDKQKVHIPARNSFLSNLEVDFDISEIENQRLIKIQRMWEGLDVIELVSSVLRDKTPARKFVCWKLLMCSRVHDVEAGNEGRHNNAGEWLLAKLLHQMPSRKKDSIFSSSRTAVHHVSVVMSNEDKVDDKVPCFYIARDLHFKYGQIEAIETSQGANGLLFLLAESASLTEERQRLHGLVNMLHSGIALPLLVIYTELEETVRSELRTLYHNLEEADAIAMFLNMNALDRSKIACWTVSCAMERRPGHSVSREFYSEERLKEGIAWLAVRAPTQRDLRSVSLHDLAMEHVQLSVRRLLAMDPSHVTPEVCVRSFNEDLLKAAREITSAASCSYPYTPPPELADIFKDKILGNIESVIPRAGWNEATYLDPIVKALYMCRLPRFPDTINVEKFEESVASLMTQKDELEQILKEYVDPGDNLRLQEISATIQNSCIFKQTSNRGHVLVPNWALIFKRLYHMRLGLLDSEVVWVERSPLEAYQGESVSIIPDPIEYRSGPTLDEMIEMEIQEGEAFRRSSDTHGILVEASIAGPVLPHDLEVDSFASADIGELQELVDYGAAQSDGVEFVRLIEAPTEGERELARMVDEFCRTVDRERDEVAKLELDGAESCCFYETGHEIDESSHQPFEPYTQQREFVSDVSVEEDGPSLDVDARGSHASHVSIPSQGTHDTDDFTRLLERCEFVQSSIDKQLDECFRM